MVNENILTSAQSKVMDEDNIKLAESIADFLNPDIKNYKKYYTQLTKKMCVRQYNLITGNSSESIASFANLRNNKFLGIEFLQTPDIMKKFVKAYSSKKDIDFNSILEQNSDMLSKENFEVARMTFNKVREITGLNYNSADLRIIVRLAFEIPMANNEGTYFEYLYQYEKDIQKLIPSLCKSYMRMVEYI